MDMRLATCLAACPHYGGIQAQVETEEHGPSQSVLGNRLTQRMAYGALQQHEARMNSAVCSVWCMVYGV
jgi:hypothetical protein